MRTNRIFSPAGLWLQKSTNGRHLNDWSSLVLRGALAIAVGGAAVIYPAWTLFLFMLLLAGFALADGLLHLFSEGAGDGDGRAAAWMRYGRAAVGILVGLSFLIVPALAAATYAIVGVVAFALWWVSIGVSELLAAIRLRKVIEGEWLLGLYGMLAILFGLALPILLVRSPGETILSLAAVFGAFAFIGGLILVAQGLRLRSRASSLAR